MADVNNTNNDTKLHEEAGRYGEALGEMRKVPGAAEHHAALDEGSENVRVAAEAMPVAQAELDEVVSEEREAKRSLRTLVYGVVEMMLYLDPNLAEKMPNLDTYEDHDIFFAADRVAGHCKADPRFSAMGEAVDAAKERRSRATDLKAAKTEARDKAKTRYAVVKAELQKAIKSAFIFITENAPKDSTAKKKIKRKRAKKDDVAEPKKADAAANDSTATATVTPIAVPA